MNTPTGKRHSTLMVALAVTLLTVGGLWRAGVFRAPGQQVLTAQKVSLNVASNSEPVSLAGFKNGFASVIDPALPAVVNISSTMVVKQPNNLPGFLKDPPFRQFFGDQFPPPSSPPQRGDVIQEVDRKPVHNIDQYRRALSGVGNQPVLLLVNRGGSTHFTVVEPQ